MSESQFPHPRIGINISAGTLLANSGQVAFSNANGISFGMQSSGSSFVVTGSVSQGNIFSLSAGTTQITSGTAVLSNSNGISFGANGATITANANSDSYWDNRAQGIVFAFSSGLVLHRVSIPRRFEATRLDMLFSVGAALNGSAYTLSFGAYTFTGSTASLASSATVGVSWTGTNSSNQTGTLWRTLSFATMAFNPGEYLFGYGISASTTAFALGGLAAVGCAKYGQFDDAYFGYGSYATDPSGGITTVSLPTSITLGQLLGDPFDNVNIPFARLLGTF